MERGRGGAVVQVGEGQKASAWERGKSSAAGELKNRFFQAGGPPVRNGFQVKGDLSQIK